MAALVAAAKSAGIAATVIGKTGGDRIKLSVNGMVAVDRSVNEAEQAWAKLTALFLLKLGSGGIALP